MAVDWRESENLVYICRPLSIPNIQHSRKNIIARNKAFTREFCGPNDLALTIASRCYHMAIICINFMALFLQTGVALCFSQEHAVGHVLKPGLVGNVFVEAHRVAHFSPDVSAPLLRHATRNRNRRDPTRLSGLT